MLRSRHAAARHPERLMKIGMIARMIAILVLLLTKWHELVRRHLIFRAIAPAALRHPEIMKNGPFGQDRECCRLIFRQLVMPLCGTQRS